MELTLNYAQPFGLFGFSVTIIHYSATGRSYTQNYGLENEKSQNIKRNHMSILFTGSLRCGHFRLLELKKPMSAKIPSGDLRVLSKSTTSNPLNTLSLTSILSSVVEHEESQQALQSQESQLLVPCFVS